MKTSLILIWVLIVSLLFAQSPKSVSGLGSAGATGSTGSTGVTGPTGSAGTLDGSTISAPLLCYDSNIAHTTAFSCTTSPSFTPTNGSLILFRFAAANNTNNTPTINVNNIGARLIQDTSQSFGPPINYLTGDGGVANSAGSYYILKYNSSDTLWIFGEQTGFAIGGANSFAGTANRVPFNVAGDGILSTFSAFTYSSTTGLGSNLYRTSQNCSVSSSPAACGTAAAGAVAVPTGVTSVVLVVNTTAVTANSIIKLQSDDSVTIAATTCNSTLATLVGGLAVTARTAGTSFTITYSGTIATNPLCVTYSIIN